MKVTVRLLSPYSDAVGRPLVEVAVPDGATVRHLVVHLCEQFPQLRPHIYEAGGGITKFAGTPRASDRGEKGELRETPPAEAGGEMTEYLTMFLNDRPVLDFDMVLGEGDEVLMMFPVSGG